MPGAPEPSPPATGWRATLRRLWAGGLAPREVGWAAGVGAAFGVAPIPGFQMAACGLIAWRFRLNLPVMLLASNVSLGPLLVLWAAVAVCLGRALFTLDTPWGVWDPIVAGFAHAGDSFAAFWAAISAVLWQWVVGSLLLMPLIGGVVGVLGWAVAAVVRRRKRA